jgi:hypothetical protein
MKNLRARFEESLAQVLEAEIDESPFQLALNEAYRRNEPALALWQRETANLVGELASLLFGTLTEGNLREAMRSADIFLSIAILFTTLQARKRPEDFLDALKEMGIAGLAEATAKLVRICGSLPEDATISDEPIDEARQNDGVARACMAKKSAFTAVSYILQILCSRVGLENKIQLGKWILSHTQSGRKILADPAAYLGRNTLDAEEILALVVPVELGLLADLPQFGDQPVTGSKQIRTTPDLSTFQVSAAKFSEVSHALQTLTSRIPAEFRHALGQDWLEEKVRIMDGRPTKSQK